MNPFELRHQVLPVLSALSAEANERQLVDAAERLRPLGSAAIDVLFEELLRHFQTDMERTAVLVGLMSYLPRDLVVARGYDIIKHSTNVQEQFAAFSIVGGLLGEDLDLTKVTPFLDDLPQLQGQITDFLLESFLFDEDGPDHFSEHLRDMDETMRAFTIENLLSLHRPESMELFWAALPLMSAPSREMLARALPELEHARTMMVLNLLLLDEHLGVRAAAHDSAARLAKAWAKNPVWALEHWGDLPWLRISLAAFGEFDDPLFAQVLLARGTTSEGVALICDLHAVHGGIVDLNVYGGDLIPLLTTWDEKSPLGENTSFLDDHITKWQRHVAVNTLHDALRCRRKQKLPDPCFLPFITAFLPDLQRAGPGRRKGPRNGLLAFGVSCCSCRKRLYPGQQRFHGLVDYPAFLCPACTKQFTTCERCGAPFAKPHLDGRLDYAPGSAGAAPFVLTGRYSSIEFQVTCERCMPLRAEDDDTSASVIPPDDEESDGSLALNLDTGALIPITLPRRRKEAADSPDATP